MTQSLLPGRLWAHTAAPFLVAAAVAACDQAGGQPHGQMPPPEVTAVSVAAKALPVAYEYVGQTAGYREVEVRARVAGIVLKRNFQEGSAVKRGQSLFTIDPAPFRVALARAEADL